MSIISFLIYRFTKQTYGVNDDVIIQSWLSGSYTGNPELMIRGSATPKMIFGLILSNLYSLIPSINWYSIVILLATLIAWYLLGVVAFNYKNWLLIIFFVLVSFIHLLWFIPSPTYTASAVLLAASTLVFFMFKVESRNIVTVLSSLIFVFAYLMRPESFYFALAICIPSFLYWFLRYQKYNLKKILIFIIISISVIGIDLFYESYYYNTNKDWAKYKTFENLRYQIQANNPEKLLLQDPEQFGWNKNEAKLFENYLTIDSETFTNQKYLQVLENLPKDEKLNLIKFLSEGHKKLINSDINWEWFSLASLIPLSFVFFLFFLWPKVKIFLIVTTFSYLFGYTIMVYVALYLRQPERVQVSAIFLGILIPLFVFMVITPKNKFKISLNQPIALIMSLITFLIAAKIYSQSQYLDKKYSGANNVFWMNEIEFLSKFPADSIFIGNASMFRNNWINPYKVSHFEVENRIMSLGWHNFSPHWETRAKNLGLNPNSLIKEIVNKSNIFWVSDPDTIKYITSFLIEKNYITAPPTFVASIDFVGDVYGVWKFTR